MRKAIGKKKPLWLVILLIVAAVLLIGCLTAFFFLQSELNRIGRNASNETVRPEDEFFETDENGSTAAGEDGGQYDRLNPEDIEWPASGDIMRDKDIMNFMLIGQDKRPGESRARSDSMMILTVNKRDKTVSVTSLMRDMYVQIPDYSDNRINAAYAFGGMELLDATIEKNFLVQIDGNMEVDFDGFMEVVDRIGGVDIGINEKEAAHLRKQGFSDLSVGTVHMDGKLALAYSRIRKVGNNDFERTQRQRKVITAAFEKVKSLGLPEIVNLVDVLFPCITTDLTNNELISLVYNIFRINPKNIATYRIPVDGSYQSAWIRGMLVLVPDLTKNREALQDIIFSGEPVNHAEETGGTVEMK